MSHLKISASLQRPVEEYSVALWKRSSTYPEVRVREICRAAVKGFQVKGLLLVKGYYFGKRSSVILTENLAVSVKKNAVEGKAKSV